MQEARTFFTGPVPGGMSAEVGVPGGTFTVKVSVCPVSSVTVTVHSSAEADGSNATAIVASTVATVTAAIFSFRLLRILA